MSAAQPLDLVARNLRIGLGLAVLMELSFGVALLAIGGAFNGGQPTTTPLTAQAYLVVGLVVTVPVIIRTWQMLKIAQHGDGAALRRTHLRAWALIALVFSGILPSIYLNAAALALPPE